MIKKTNILFHIPYDPIYIIVLKRQNFRNGEQQWLPGLRGWRKRWEAGVMVENVIINVQYRGF